MQATQQQQQLLLLPVVLRICVCVYTLRRARVRVWPFLVWLVSSRSPVSTSKVDLIETNLRRGRQREALICII